MSLFQMYQHWELGTKEIIFIVIFTKVHSPNIDTFTLKTRYTITKTFSMQKLFRIHLHLSLAWADDAAIKRKIDAINQFVFILTDFPELFGRLNEKFRFTWFNWFNRTDWICSAIVLLYDYLYKLKIQRPTTKIQLEWLIMICQI